MEGEMDLYKSDQSRGEKKKDLTEVFKQLHFKQHLLSNFQYFLFYLKAIFCKGPGFGSHVYCCEDLLGTLKQKTKKKS